MTTRYAWLIVLCMSWCGDQATCVDCPQDAGDPIAEDAGDPVAHGPRSVQFLVVALRIESGWVDGRPAAAGFDLDEIDSDGAGTDCTNAQDFFYLPSFRTPLAGGVDNAFFGALRQEGIVDAGPGVPPVDTFGYFLDDSIYSGPYRMILEVSGIDSFESDPSVEVRSALARPAACDGGGIECPLQLAASGEYVVGQRLVLVSPEPLAATGAISAGRLRVTLPRLAGPVVVTNYSGERHPVPSEFVRLDAAISADALTQGMLGGTFAVDDYVRAFDPGTAAEDVWPDVLGHADFAPRIDDPQLCDGMSFGLTFDAIRVQAD